MTPAMVAELERFQGLEQHEDVPSLENPAVGQPITHARVLALWRLRCSHDTSQDGQDVRSTGLSLDALLRGSQVYVEPPKPKPEPTAEYKTLMARLRADQEERNYERMLSPPASSSFAQRFPTSQYAHLFPDSQATTASASSATTALHDEMTLTDINRQLALIANVLISIVACACAIWWATWHWSVGLRLGASMGGAGAIGIAEVVVYLGYIQRLEEAKGKEAKKKERKSVTRTWVIEGNRKGAVEKRVVEEVPRDVDRVQAQGSGLPEPPEYLRRRKTRVI